MAIKRLLRVSQKSKLHSFIRPEGRTSLRKPMEHLRDGSVTKTIQIIELR